MADQPTVKESENRSIIEFFQNNKRVEHLQAVEPDGEVSLIAVPQGYTLQSTKPFVDAMRELPVRSKGTSEHLSLESLVAHINRFKDEGTVLFADVSNKNAPGLLAVLDYTMPGHPRNGDWRASYNFPISEEWLRWGRSFVEAGSSGGITQAQFAELLEERATDLLHPDSAGEVLKDDMGKVGLALGTPQEMLALSRGLAVSSESKLANAVKLDNGGVKLQWEETSTAGDPTTGAPVTVPGGFVIAIPVFDGGEVFQLAVRLRYRKNGPNLVWQLIPRRKNKVFDVAVRDTASKVQLATDVPLFYGRPESIVGNDD
jgi:hypothetical protein